MIHLSQQSEISNSSLNDHLAEKAQHSMGGASNKEKHAEGELNQDIRELQNSKPSPPSPPANNNNTLKSPNADKNHTRLKWWRRWKVFLERCLEDPFVQIIVLLLVHIDIILEFWLISNQLMAINTESNESRTVSAAIAAGGIDLTKPIVILRRLILYIHTLELVLQMAVFHVRFFSHWGYAGDTVLIVTRLLSQNGLIHIMVGRTHYSPLLGFLRFWRLVPLIQSFIIIERREHMATKRELSMQKESMQECERKVGLLEAEVEHERTVRKQNGEMVKGFQEEVETLREALKIAAVEAAMNGNGIGDDRGKSD